MASKILRRRSRRGNYGTLFGLTLPVLLGGAAVAVDLSYQKVVYAQLQAVADAASSTGAAYLDGTPEGVAAARDAAIRAALRNKADGRPVVLDPGDIVMGYWDVDAWRFVPSTDPELIDAMKVQLSRDDIASNFASVNAVGRRTIGAVARSIATRPETVPAGAVSCYIPLAIPDCLFDEYEDDELTEFTFQLNPAGIDNVGWARVDGHPNTNWLRDQIADCHMDGVAIVGDDVYLDNGVKTPALRAIADEIEDADSDSEWDSEEWGEQPEQSDNSDVDSDAYGKIYSGAIIVFDGGDEYCNCDPVDDEHDSDGDTESDSDEDTDSDTDSDSDSDDDTDTEGDSDRDTEGDSDDRGTHDPDAHHGGHDDSEHDSDAGSEDHDDDSDSDSDSDSEDDTDTDGDSDTDSDTDSDDDGTDVCEFDSGHFNGVETITGFAWAEIYDVRVSGSASQKNIWLRIDPFADQNVGTASGGQVDGGVQFGVKSAVVQ